MSLPDWREEPMAKKHDRTSFDGGEPALNEFLRRHARQSHDKGAAKTFPAISRISIDSAASRNSSPAGAAPRAWERAKP